MATPATTSGFNLLQKLPFVPKSDKIESWNDDKLLATFRVNYKWKQAVLQIMARPGEASFSTKTLLSKISRGRLFSGQMRQLIVSIDSAPLSESDVEQIKALHFDVIYMDNSNNEYLFRSDLRKATPDDVQMAMDTCTGFFVKEIAQLTKEEWDLFDKTTARKNLCSYLLGSSLNGKTYVFMSYEITEESTESLTDPASVCSVILASTQQNNVMYLDFICARRPGSGVLLFRKAYDFLKEKLFFELKLQPANATLRDLYISKYGFSPETETSPFLRRLITENSALPRARFVFPDTPEFQTLTPAFPALPVPPVGAFCVEDTYYVVMYAKELLLGTEKVPVLFSYCKLYKNKPDARYSRDIADILIHYAQGHACEQVGKGKPYVISALFTDDIEEELCTRLGYVRACGDGLKFKILRTTILATEELYTQSCSNILLLLEGEDREPPEFEPGDLVDWDDIAIDKPEEKQEAAHAQTACGNGEPWAPATTPLVPEQNSVLFSVELNNLQRDIQADAQLNTQIHRDTLIRGLQIMSISGDAFHGSLRAWLGFAPVSKDVPFQSRGGTVLRDETSYIGQLLSWAENHRDAFQSVLQGLFELEYDNGQQQQHEISLEDRKSRVISSNCAEDVNIPLLCAQYRRRHRRGFEKYWTNHSTPMRERLLFWYMPKYSAYGVPFTNGIPRTRLKFMQNAWNRKLRQETLVDACVFFGLDIERSRLQLHDKESPIARELILFLTTLPETARKNRVLQYLLANEPHPAFTEFFTTDNLPEVPLHVKCQPDQAWFNDESNATFIAAKQQIEQNVERLDVSSITTPAAQTAYQAFSENVLDANILNTALVSSRINVLEFAKQIPSFVGLQPVQSNAQKVLPYTANVADTGENSYLSQFVDWAKLNPKAMRLVMFGVFGSEAARAIVEEYVSFMRRLNCREPVNLYFYTLNNLTKRQVQKTYADWYHNKATIYEDEAIVDLFTLKLPKFSVSRVPDTNDVPQSRQLAIQRGWEHKRLHDFASVYVFAYLEAVAEARKEVHRHMANLPEQESKKLGDWFAATTPPFGFTTTLYELFK